MATRTRKAPATGEKAKASKAAAKKQARAARPTSKSYVQEQIVALRGILSSIVGKAQVAYAEDDAFLAYGAEYVLWSLDMVEAEMAKSRPDATKVRNLIQRVYQTGKKCSSGEATFTVGGKDRKPSEAKLSKLQSTAQLIWQAARRVEQGKASFSG